MKIERIDIGLTIEQKMNELDISKSELSRRCGIANQNINRVFNKPSIDTNKLIAISEALGYNFFKEYVDEEPVAAPSVETRGDFSPASMHGNVSVGGDALLAERVKSLEALLAEKERLIRVLLEERK
jgi:DNA-binding Xre family transcriptional regulator